MKETEPKPPTLDEQIVWAEQRHRHAIHMYGGKDPTSRMWAAVIESIRAARPTSVEVAA